MEIMPQGLSRADVVVLSPHLDDAVLAVGGMISREAAAGRRVEVWTCYTAGPALDQIPANLRPLGDYSTRRDEDQRALGVLGAGYRWLDLPERIWREPALRREHHIFHTPQSRERFQYLPALRPIVRELLNTVLDSLANGVPVVAVHDQCLLAHERTQAFGKRIPPGPGFSGSSGQHRWSLNRLTPEPLRNAVKGVLERDDYRAAAQRLAGSIRAAGGTRRAADYRGRGDAVAMAHFGLVCPPGTSHVTGLTTIARELCRRGHRATVFNILDVKISPGAKAWGSGRSASEAPQGRLQGILRHAGSPAGHGRLRFGLQVAREEIAMLSRKHPAR